MSHRGVSTEEIARLVGHSSTRTTEVIYRKELRPVINTGATIMDGLFPSPIRLPILMRCLPPVARPSKAQYRDVGVG
jgi:hypothetical protein